MDFELPKETSSIIKVIGVGGGGGRGGDGACPHRPGGVSGG